MFAGASRSTFAGEEMPSVRRVQTVQYDSNVPGVGIELLTVRSVVKTYQEEVKDNIIYLIVESHYYYCCYCCCPVLSAVYCTLPHSTVVLLLLCCTVSILSRFEHFANSSRSIHRE